MFKKRSIDKTNYLYRIFHALLSSVFHLFNRRVVVIGKENLPKGEAFFVTPNHQNAMMDAMAVLFTIGRPNPVFMARADMFKKKFFATLLHFIKILPVYRIRDGKDSLKNNEDVFQQTIDIVRKGVPLIIFPEGSHDGHRRFRVVKKGIIRTAFSALEQFGDKKLYIVPTGIEYNPSYEKTMQNLVVFYGKPILVNDFREIYEEDKARAERQLQLELYARMSDQMIDIKTKDYYDFYDIVRETVYTEIVVGKDVKDTPEQKLYAQQDLIKALNVALENDESVFADLQDKALEYRQLTQKMNLTDTQMLEKTSSFGKNALDLIIALLLLPITLCGLVFSGAQFHLANKLADGKKDTQWRSTMRYVMGFTLMPFTHLLMMFLSFLLFANNWWSVALVFSFVLTGYFSLRYKCWLDIVMGRLRYNKLHRQNDATLAKAEALRQEINAFAMSAYKQASR